MRVKLLFAGAFVLLITSIVKLRFFVDDYLFFYNSPRLIDNFFIFFQNYTHQFGIYRPVSVVYYYFIYSLYSFSPALAHLIPWLLQVISGYLLYHVLKLQKLSLVFAIIISLIFIFHPFATEQYMWLAANQGVLVSLLFFIEIILLTKQNNLRHSLITTFIFSTILTFTYESTFFFFVPLIYFLYQKYHHSLLRIISVNLIPVFLYITTKVIITPQDPRPLVNNLSQLTYNFTSLNQNLLNIFLDPYYQNRFWIQYGLQGYQELFFNPANLIILLFFLAGLSFILFIQKTDTRHNFTSPTIVFWSLAFISSLPPLLANQEFYFGFRALFLPIIITTIIVFFTFELILGKNMRRLVFILSIISISWFVQIDIHIATEYRKMFDHDISLASLISKASSPNSTIVFNSLPHLDTRDTFIHADHILSCFHYEWCAPSILKTQNNSIQNIFLSYIYLPPRLDQLRPLIYLTYQPDKTLKVDKIIP